MQIFTFDGVVVDAAVLGGKGGRGMAREGGEGKGGREKS